MIMTFLYLKNKVPHKSQDSCQHCIEHLFCVPGSVLVQVDKRDINFYNFFGSLLVGAEEQTIKKMPGWGEGWGGCKC